MFSVNFSKITKIRILAYMAIFSLTINYLVIDISTTNAAQNPGAIWTTTSSCGTPQNVNAYDIGDDVYINGDNFNVGLYDWDITGQPGGASADPNIVVASGNGYFVSASGAFCFKAYTVAADDDGVYNVDFGGKNDNYSVNGISATCGDGQINQTSEQCDGTDGVGLHQTCTDQCILVDLTYCGDGTTQTPNDEATGGPSNDGNEQCDGTDGVGENQECTDQCSLVNLAHCGDGIVNLTEEQCDGTDGVGEHQECSDQCILVDLPYCGDGFLNAGEQCDGISGYGAHQMCNEFCEVVDLTYCGDGLVQTPNDEATGGPAGDGNEECDITLL